MKMFIPNILLFGLSLSLTTGELRAQQSESKKGTLTAGTLPLITSSTLQLKKANESDLKSKEISREVAMPKNGEVYIENNSRNIVVKTWDQPKVKITTTVQYDGEGNLTEDEWFEKANLSLKTLGSSVKIKAGLINNIAAYTTNLSNGNINGLTEVVVTGHSLSSTKSPKKLVTVYLPVGSKIDIESKYSEITLPAGIGDVNVDISNGNLDAENLGKFILRSKYGIINVGDIKTAEIEFTGGRLTAKNIDDLDLDSKYSTIELALAKKAVVRSTNDEYEFEEVGELSGRKNYGNFRITKLLQKIDLEGVNADIKVRNIAPTVSLIKINDKYADIRLPVKNTKSYAIDFLGAYSSVYGNFEKKSLPVTDKDIPFLGLAAGYTVDTAGNITKRILVEGKQIYTANNNGKPTITSLGALSAITVARSIPASGLVATNIPNRVSGTVEGGTFSGTLSAYRIEQLQALNNLEPITVSGYGNSSKRDTITINASGGRATAPSTYVGSSGQSITSAGGTSSLTVAGYITSVGGQVSPAYTVSGQTRGSDNKLNYTSSLTATDHVYVSGTQITDTYRTPTGVITGGTYVPFNRAYSYTGENDTPSKFSAIVGDGKGLKIELKCPNCTVDFK